MSLTNRRSDPWLIAAVALLLVWGPIMVYSSSAVVALDQSGDEMYFFTRQLIAIGVGLVLCAGTALVPVDLLRRYRWVLYIGTLVALVLCFVPGINHTAKGASRWIGVGSVHLQPSEFAKVTVMLVLADFLDRHRGVLGDPKVLVRAMLLPAPIMGLVFFEPDFGTTAIIGGVCAIMLFLAGLRMMHMGAAVLVGVVLGVPMMLLEEYRLQRLTSFVDPWAVADGEGYQVIQSWVALHSGGLTGQGLGNGLGKLYFLPEPWNDFIAAVIGEELGFLGLVGVMVLYSVLLWRGLVIARGARDAFGMLLAGSLTAMLVLQAFFNMAVVLGLVPPKGLVLPFVSYGASAVMAHLWCIGVLLSIAAEADATPAHEGWVASKAPRRMTAGRA